ncbi:MAG TPA: aldo/keto reductase [Acetobacteraceae bacterium]|nr:aldo/keto reductase [Acetobacteraceae bacterium]
MFTGFRERRIGETALAVMEFGLGDTPLGNMFDNMYRTTETETAVATVHAVAAAGIRYFDTASIYDFGLGEMRLGKGMATLPREKIAISSKAGDSLVPVDPGELKPGLWDRLPPMRADFDCSCDAMPRSLEASPKRLDTPSVGTSYVGTSYVGTLAIHDPDEAVDVGAGVEPFSCSHFKAAMDEDFPTLAGLRSQVVIKAIGIGIDQGLMPCDFATAGDFDYFLLTGRYTLLDQDSMRRLLPLCEQRSISLVIGGPYNSGILATGVIDLATGDDRPASPAILDRVRKIEAACARHDVPLQAAAPQFPLRHPLVASIIPGARPVAGGEANLAFLHAPMPSQFWAELKHERLIHEATPVGR